MASATLNYQLPYPLDTDAVDVAGDIRNLANKIDEDLDSIVFDDIGSMVSGNTEYGMSVSYDSNNSKLDFEVNDFEISLSGSLSGSAIVNGLSNTNLAVSANDFSLNFLGGVSGSATISDLQNTDISLEVGQDSHSHSASTIISFTLEDLENVENSSIIDGEALIYDSASNTWINQIPGKKLFIAEYDSDFTVEVQDSGKILGLNSASTINVTIPNSSSIDFDSGSIIKFIQTGSGSINFVPSGGVTILSVDNKTSMSTQYSTSEVFKYDSNTWVLSGEIV